MKTNIPATIRRMAIQANAEAARLLHADPSSERARELLAAAIRLEDRADHIEAITDAEAVLAWHRDLLAEPAAA